VTRFADKYKIDSTRLAGWNYSTPGTYFITICTVHHNNFFGTIVDNQMVLSDRGIIAQPCSFTCPVGWSTVL